MSNKEEMAESRVWRFTLTICIVLSQKQEAISNSFTIWPFKFLLEAERFWKISCETFGLRQGFKIFFFRELAGGLRRNLSPYPAASFLEEKRKRALDNPLRITKIKSNTEKVETVV